MKRTPPATRREMRSVPVQRPMRPGNLTDVEHREHSRDDDSDTPRALGHSARGYAVHPRGAAPATLDDDALDRLQFALDLAGMAPGIGNAADLLNALISVGRGDLVDALDRAASLLPVAGQAATMRRMAKLGDDAKDALRAGKGKARAAGSKDAVRHGTVEAPTGSGERPPLRPIHKDTYSEATLESYRKLSNEEIVEALRRRPLKVKADGTMMDGHHRVKVLRERGYDVESLPREPYDSGNDRFFPDLPVRSK